MLSDKEVLKLKWEEKRENEKEGGGDLGLEGKGF